MTGILVRALRLLAWGIAGIVIVPLLAFLYYDVTEFQSRRDDIAQLIAAAHPAERAPPALLRRLLLTEHHGDLSSKAARLLLFKLDVPGAWRRGLSRQGNSALWWLLVRLHLSKDEQLAIVCSSTFLGRRAYGFEAGAQAYFQRPLIRLTDRELATLVISSLAESLEPARSRGGSDRGARWAARAYVCCRARSTLTSRAVIR